MPDQNIFIAEIGRRFELFKQRAENLQVNESEDLSNRLIQSIFALSLIKKGLY
jgi:hypothetical protein